MNIIIENGIVLSDKVISDGAVVIEGNYIVDVGDVTEIKRRYSSSGYIRLDAGGKIVAPGFVNSHTHISMTLLRGYADDISLQDWLENWIWPFESLLSDKDIELGALLGCAESLLSGVTTVGSLYHYHSNYNEVTAALKAGIRMLFGVAIFSWDIDRCVKNVEDAFRRWYGSGDGLVRIAVSPHAPYTVSPDHWKLAEELRSKYDDELSDDFTNVVITTHILEDWREVEMVKEKFGVDVPNNSIYLYLDKIGVLSEYLQAAHSIHMNDVDFEVVSSRGVKIAHNPIANLKLGMGIADIVKMMDLGIKIGLGTDGPASNNTLDLIETMKIASLLPKGIYRDPTRPQAIDVYRMATIDGGLSLGYRNLGVLKKGFLADVILIDLKNPNMQPLHNVYSNLIYSLKASDVDTVIVNGDVVVEDRFLKTIDLEDLIMRVTKRILEIKDKLS